MFDSELECVDSAQLRAAAALPPGPEQWAAVRGLDVGSLSHDDLLVAVALVERCKAVLDADQQPLYAALADPDPGGGDGEWVRDELALAVKLSANTCGSRLMVGRALTARFPDTLGLMATGQVTYWYGRALVDETAWLTSEKAAVVEKRVLDRAPGLHLGEYREAVRRAVVAVDPEGAAERARLAQRDRAVWVFAADDATATLGASRLPVADAVAAYEHIDSLARAAAGDGRTLDQRRADTFLALLRGEHLDQVRPVPATVEVVVSAETLHGGDGPGELAQVGPIPAPLARALAYAAGSRWRRLVSDPATGWLQACGEKAYRPGAWASIYTDPVEPAPGAEPQYRPSPRLDRYVRARDRRCSFPGCTRRARRSDLDHTIPWPRGDTTAANLHPCADTTTGSRPERNAGNSRTTPTAPGRGPHRAAAGTSRRPMTTVT
ncbi:MAG TPA: DUF222 domain-containing protein [Streptosporangiales bacterium]